MTIRDTIQSLAINFANEIVAAVRAATIESIGDFDAGETPRARRPYATSVDAPSTPRAKRPAGRLPRRSAQDLQGTLATVLSLLGKSDGLRAEDIRKELSLDVREMPRVIKLGLDTGVITRKGEKRATVYFDATAAPKAKKIPSKAPSKPTTKKPAAKAPVKKATVKKTSAKPAKASVKKSSKKA